MATFIVKVNHPLEPFELNNLTSARMDLVARCVNAALWLDHGIRRDVVVYFCFSNNITVRIDGRVRNMNPDERNIASFFKHIQGGKSFPGISLNRAGLWDVVAEAKARNCFVLDKNGIDISEFTKNHSIQDSVFLLGDDIGLSKKEVVKASELGFVPLSIGPKSYFTSQCICFLNIWLDRFG
ncbi:MAG: hypothetical protein QXO69_01420 [archaeon]